MSAERLAGSAAGSWDDLDSSDTLRIVVCGDPGAGKSTVAASLREVGWSPRRLEVSDPIAGERGTDTLIGQTPAAACALIVVDARHGIGAEARRHGQVTALLGVKKLVLVLNKVDLLGDAGGLGDVDGQLSEMTSQFNRFATGLGVSEIECIPVSALGADNFVGRSPQMSWYEGPTLVGSLKEVGGENERRRTLPFRLPVTEEQVGGVRRYAGTVASGSVRRGDEVVIATSGRRARIERISGAAGELDLATAGTRVALTLADGAAPAAADLIAHPGDAPSLADQLRVTVLWLAEKPMLRGRSYLVQTVAGTVTATAAPIKYRLNVENGERVAATKLERDEIGACDLELSGAVAFDPYPENHVTGRIMLVDRISGETLGVGLIQFELRRAHNLQWQALSVGRHDREALLQQRPTVLWLTGLSGAGKSTLANQLEISLHERGHLTYLLDGDNVRHGLNADLGFTDADRAENIRRVAEVARLMTDAGLIVLVSFISPFRAEREMARALFEEGEFVEIHVDVPLAIAEGRDPKGLYQKARRGELRNFTGIDSPYEPPDRPEVRIDTTLTPPGAAAAEIVELLERTGRLPGQESS